MSRMSDLDIEMQEMLERGSSVEDVASYFNVPIDWVYQARHHLYESLCGDCFDDIELND
jgi:hypothetical protein